MMRVIPSRRAERSTRKNPSGVRTSSPATSGIAAFAVTASCTRRWYENTSRMRTTKTYRQACTSTSTGQFGSERKCHDYLSVGLSRAVRGGGSALKGKKVPPKYRGLSGETWAGRGAKPRWLVAAIKGGRKLDDFLIDKSARKGRRKRRSKR